MTTENILALAAPLLYAVFAVVFWSLWARDTGALWKGLIAASYTTAVIGFCIFHFGGEPDGVVAASLMHIFYTVSSVGLVWGVARRNGVRFDLRVYAAVGLAGMALMIGASHGEDYNARLYVANACYGLILALGCQDAARKPEKDLLDKTILALLAIGALQFFSRPLVAIIIEGSMTAQEYRDTPFYAIMVVWLTLSSLLMAMALLIAALTDQMKAQREDAGRDPLTGLPTRGPFEEEVIAMLERNRDEHGAVSVVVADIDRFKTVNDTFGHQVGDSAIAAFGKVIADQIRAGDHAGRIGGEEFCIVLPGCDAEAASAMAERVRRALLQANVQGMPDSLRLTASFGVAERRGREGYARMFARADAALYEAKKGGRNCVRIEGEAGDAAAPLLPPIANQRRA